MTETGHRPHPAVVPVTSGALAAAGLIAERAHLALADLQAENEHLKAALAKIAKTGAASRVSTAQLLGRIAGRALGWDVDSTDPHLEPAAGTCGECEDGLISIGRCNCGSPADSSIGYMHERLCGFEPCPNGCWDRLHPATGGAS